MKMHFIIICLFFSFTMLAQGIVFFEGTWKDAIAKAKKEDKLMFVDAYAEWCGPCKAMAKNVFTQEKAGKFYNDNFINLKLDMEKADGVSFGHKYPVSAYPTLLFVDGDGKLIKRIVGGQNVDNLIKHGQEANRMYDRSGRYEKQYQEGDRSYDLMLNYVTALNAAGKPTLKISNEYLNANSAITEDQKNNFYLEAATEVDSKIFDYIVSNKIKIISLVGKEKFETKVKSACNASFKKALDFEMESLMTETLEKAKKTIPEEAEILGSKAQMEYYKMYRNESKYISAYKLYGKKSHHQSDALKMIIQDIMTHFKSNPAMMKDALNYSEMNYKMKNDFESLTMYVSILVETKDIDKALNIAKQAKEKAEKEGANLQQYEGVINYLMSKKA